MSAIAKKWRCNSCYDLHDSEDEAIECCQPSVSEVFCCPTCGEGHGDESDAIDCCEENASLDLEATEDDGRKFPAHGEFMTTEQYIAAYNALNAPQLAVPK